ncbi:MAG: hypothetical protein FWE47_04740 [Oscillospiraceae bacterium]|nr:hypothetical protein [Oscillospiraceae bacterium]
MQLAERQTKILKAIIESYIATGEPVGSRTLSKIGDMELSPATLRNEMADLVDMGLLEHPHVSSGRVPTDKGYRYYVENIMPRPIVPFDEKERLKTLIEEKSSQVHGLVREIADLYSKMINYTVFSLPSEVSEQIVMRGITNFLNFPEYSNIAKAKRVLDFLDDDDALKNALAPLSASEQKMDIIIGDENIAEEIKDCSIVVSKYKSKDGRVGTIGVIGPKRMDYGKAISTLDLITRELEGS